MSTPKKPGAQKSSKSKAEEPRTASTAPELIVRPSRTGDINSSKVYVALDTLRSLGINAGSLVQISKSPIVAGIATPGSLDPDLINVSRTLRKIAGLQLGDRIVPKQIARPVTAGIVRIYTQTDSDDQPVKQMLEELAIVNVGQQFNGFVVSALEPAKSKSLAGLEQDLSGLSVSSKPTMAQPEGPMMVGPETKVIFTSMKPPAGRQVGYRSIAGLDKEIKDLRSKIELPLSHPELFERFNTSPERGFLLYGPPGTGKTLLLRAIANETEAHVFRINGPALYSKYLGESESSLRKTFEEAQRFAPSVIFIDEIDALAPKRDGDESGETESRVVATLLTLMDGMNAGDRVVVIGATNRPNSIDPALRRPGRFGQEIEIGIPDARGRQAILELQLDSIPHHLNSSTIESIANKTHGYVGADLTALGREAVMQALNTGLSKKLKTAEMFLEKEHYDAALAIIRPSAMREIFLETPKVYWTEIGGQEKVIKQLRETVEWPLQHPEAFDRLGVTPPRGVLLHGPPGNSKTLLVKALATESGLNFLAVKGPELFNKYVGESERAIREVFRKARATAPSIIFFDEIDAVSIARGESGSAGDRVLTSMLNEMDGIESLSGVVVIAATNRPDVIDSALMRPGRLDRIIHVPPPDDAGRRQIFLIALAKMAVDDSVDVDELTLRTKGFSGAEIVNVCREAALIAMNEDINVPSVRQEHFHQALNDLESSSLEAESH